MMIFSAVWIMVIYLNIPTTQQQIQDVTVTTSSGTTITIPSIETETWDTATWANDADLVWSDTTSWTDSIDNDENQVATWA